MEKRLENDERDEFGQFDPKQLILRMTIQQAINEIEEPFRQAVEVVFDTMVQERPLILQEIADTLGISFSTFYQRLGKGLYLLAVRLKSEQDVVDLFPDAEADTLDPFLNRVSRLIKSFSS